MLRFLIVSVAIATVAISLGASAGRQSVHTQTSACLFAKRFAAKMDHLPLSGPPNMGWYCDFSLSDDPDLYVISLHSKRREPGSSLMGWYAVQKSTGITGEFDVGENKMRSSN
jgi:hypothetical protein